MREIIKIICFLSLVGLVLGGIFNVATFVWQYRSIPACTSDQECQDQYLQNVMRCLPYESDGNSAIDLCGDVIDPEFIAIKDGWTERQKKFTAIVDAERKKFSAEAFQAKQEQVRKALEAYIHQNEIKALVVEVVYGIFIILPFASCLADWFLARRMKRVLPGEVAPSALIMLTLLLFIAAMIGGSFINLGQFNAVGFGISAFTLVMAILLALAVKQEFKKFRKCFPGRSIEGKGQGV